MAEIITYSLRAGAKRSDMYYQQISAFSDRVLAAAEARLGYAVDGYLAQLSAAGEPDIRSRAEYLFELLTLGVLWQVYGGQCQRAGENQLRLLGTLVSWREAHEWAKPVVDRIRGVVGGNLAGPAGDTFERERPTAAGIRQLLKWMEATGEFGEEVKRLWPWLIYFQGAPAAVVEAQLEAVDEMAVWFDGSSLEVLGHYTPNVERFVASSGQRYRWREDRLFCGRRRVEYHMNMVGTELLNRSFRDKFLATKNRVVLLPPCMKAQQDECKAVETPYGELCQACTPGCPVHQATKLGEKHGFKVFILPHELNVFADGKSQPAISDPTTGIVGVSCPLTNVTGGWETREKGIPAQGVLLDHCGCSWHWHLDGGLMTELNFKKLLSVVGSSRAASTA